MPITRPDPSASCSCGCGRPARELNGLSTACWMALSPAQRHHYQWVARGGSETGDTIAFDPVAIELEIKALPVFLGPRRYHA